MKALNIFNNDCETSMQIIDRGLYLLRNHVETFRQKYAYQVYSLYLDYILVPFLIGSFVSLTFI